MPFCVSILIDALTDEIEDEKRAVGKKKATKKTVKKSPGRRPGRIARSSRFPQDSNSLNPCRMIALLTGKPATIRE
jgi:hypothetical protein